MSRRGGSHLAERPVGVSQVQLGLGFSEDAVDPDFAWDEMRMLKRATDLKPSRAPSGGVFGFRRSRRATQISVEARYLGRGLRRYCLRVYVYQARHLPAADDDGLLNPYVKVRFKGSKEKTKARGATTNPLFYETLSFHEMLPEDVRYGPDVLLQIWDAHSLARNRSVASARIPLAECPVLGHDAARPPDPLWRRARDSAGRPTGAEVLCAAALLPKREHNEKVSKPASISPPMKNAWVEVTVVGVRRLRGRALGNPRKPWLKVDVPGIGGGDNSAGFRTPASDRPSGRDANFLVRRTLNMELPENALYSRPSGVLALHGPSRGFKRRDKDQARPERDPAQVRAAPRSTSLRGRRGGPARAVVRRLRRGPGAEASVERRRLRRAADATVRRRRGPRGSTRRSREACFFVRACA